MNRRPVFFQGIVFATLLASCTTQVPMPDLNYPVNAVKRDATVTVVIDRDSLNHQFQTQRKAYRFEPGILLKLVAEAELSPMFTRYTFETGCHEAGQGGTDITLVLKLKEYRYDARATGAFSAVSEAGYIVLASAYNHDGARLFNNVYVGKAEYQPPDTFYNYMTSRIQQPSLEALKQVFGKLRVDLDKVLTVARSR